MLSDEVLLVSATRNRDRDALAYFFERHQLSVYRTCLGVLRRPDLAEDATQETFVTVLERGSTVRSDHGVRGWLHRVARNASLQVLRSERRRGQRELAAGIARLQATGQNELDLPAAALDHAVLRRHINDLAARWRIPILLRYEQGMPYAEIAAVLGVQEGTIGSRIHRGLAMLRDALEPSGVMVSTPELEQAIAELPPRSLPPKLEEALHSLAARGVPTGRPLFWRSPALVGGTTLVGLVVLTTLGWLAWVLLQVPEAPPLPTVSQNVADANYTRICQALEVYSLALRSRFLDPTLNQRTAVLLAELNGPDGLLPDHADRLAYSRLAAILMECTNQQPSYSEMDWKELERHAIELRNYPTLGALGDRMIDWVRAEHTAKGDLGDGRDYLRSNRLDEAFSALARIGEESVYGKEAATRMVELKTAITDRTLREANQRIRGGDYQSTLDEIDRVLTLFENKYPDVVVALSGPRKECERNLEYQDLVAAAQTLIDRGEMDDAERKLASIDLGAPAPVLSAAERLHGKIHFQRTMAAATERYSNGDGHAALQILRDETHPELVALRAKIEKVVHATAMAQNAEARGLHDVVRQCWGEVLGLEEDERNRYRIEAFKRMDSTGPIREEAEQEYKKGFEAQLADRLGEARLHYDKALEVLPGHGGATAAIALFKREAQKTYNLDKLAFQQGKITLDVIIPKWENILSFLRPEDGGVYRFYQAGLEKLKTTGKF